jgi:hypothetical protein
MTAYLGSLLLPMKVAVRNLSNLTEKNSMFEIK